MSSVNKVILVGNLTRDPEARETKSGKVVTMTVATSERWSDRASGEKKERSEFHRCVVFDERLADVAERYLSKGSQVYVSGQLQTRKWTDQSGQERYTTEVVLGRYRGELQMLGSPPKGGSGGGGGRSERADAVPQGGHDDLDDEIPF